MPLKHLSNFWKSIEMTLMKCETELKLKWKKYCVLSAAGADDNHANYNILIILFSLSKIHFSPHCLQKIIKNY